jgi:adenylate cyclase
MVDEAEGESSYLIVRPTDAAESRVPIHGHLTVGRECFGIDDEHRLVIADSGVSRRHVEIRLAPELDQALVIDLSTNGTRLNGVRIERGVASPLRAGDRLRVGPVELEFCSDRFRESGSGDGQSTVAAISPSEMVMVVGDVIGFTELSERTPSDVLASGMGELFAELWGLVREHKGILANHAGDAFFVVWERDAVSDAADLGIEFALAADEHVRGRPAELPFATVDGGPLRMGWAVVLGKVGVSSLAGHLMTVIGDATNLAFRLSSLAGREGRPSVVVTEQVRSLAGPSFRFAEAEQVTVKGRVGVETILGVEPG